MTIADVVCLVFPDGTVKWCRNAGEQRRAIKEWRESNREYDDMHCTMGAVHLRMPEENIPT